MYWLGGSDPFLAVGEDAVGEEGRGPSGRATGRGKDETSRGREPSQLGEELVGFRGLSKAL
jgi:hypothetical protein